MYKCPNCGRIYNYGNLNYDVIINCLNCRYPLKKIEDVKNVKHPELNEHHVIGMLQDTTKPTPKCPTCQSTNVQKIEIGERVASVAIFGIFSKKINKSFKCKNCGYTW